MTVLLMDDMGPRLGVLSSDGFVCFLLCGVRPLFRDVVLLLNGFAMPCGTFDELGGALKDVFERLIHCVVKWILCVCCCF